MDILTHNQIWSAIDALAENLGLSPSGLARKSGLDPTSFNPSKRFTSAGRERWPSTESIAKILKSTGTSVDDFMAFVGEAGAVDIDGPNIDYRTAMKPKGIPLIGFAEAGKGGYFDDGGFPVGGGWDYIDLPASNNNDGYYALKVSGDSMLPLYREDDILIVDPAAKPRRWDRVVAKTKAGEVFAKILARNSASLVELKSLNPEHPDLSFEVAEVEWIARIVWASQ